MKNSVKLLTMTAVAAGCILGLMISPDKGSENRKQLGKRVRKLSALLNGECNREKLLVAKEKLEEQKRRIEHHLQGIERRLAVDVVL